MNLVMLDVDGTLTQSYEYDRDIMGLAIADVLGCAQIDADLNGYVDKTSTGVTQEAIRRITGVIPSAGQLEKVKRNVQGRLEKMYQESPKIFSQIPGAAGFVDRLRSLEGAGIAIATGCWHGEALFKLKASGVNVIGIPMATSDDDKNRTRIMQIAAERAGDFYGCPRFERVVYIGDGPWDLQEARALGYRFIGIGPRVQAHQGGGNGRWHPDFLELEQVIASVTAVLSL
jgi:phosphoglycolate phosphatase-like HAD superfamily hydrolase